MKVRWEVEDGYVGKSRPQYTEIPDEEWLECETESDRELLLEDYIQTDFDNNISWAIMHIEEPENNEGRE